MSDQEKKQETNITPQPDAEKQSSELSEEELKKVAGGAPTISDITVTKTLDKASPGFF